MPAYNELGRNPDQDQTRSVKPILAFAINILDECIEATETEAEGSILSGAKKILTESSIVSAKLLKRSEREQDLQRKRRGEHSGLHWECELDNGSTMHINIKGGLREVSPMDTTDSQWQFTSGDGQAQRTIETISAPTEFNVNVTSHTGFKDVDIWIIVHLNSNKPSILQRVDYLGDTTEPRIFLPPNMVSKLLEKQNFKALIKSSIREIGD